VENYQHYLHGCELLGSAIYGSENSHAREVNCLKIRQKKLNFKRKRCKIDVKVTENQNFPVFICHYSTDVAEGF
jgi:hypothetical protein